MKWVIAIPSVGAPWANRLDDGSANAIAAQAVLSCEPQPRFAGKIVRPSASLRSRPASPFEGHSKDCRLFGPAHIVLPHSAISELDCGLRPFGPHTGTAKEIAVLRGHNAPVYSATFSPDGSRIVTASVDRTARIWDAATAKEIAVLRGHDASVSSAAFNPDGKRIVTASSDRTARIWDAATAKEDRDPARP
jgi:WD40 repeat protein